MNEFTITVDNNAFEFVLQYGSVKKRFQSVDACLTHLRSQLQHVRFDGAPCEEAICDQHDL